MTDQRGALAAGFAATTIWGLAPILYKELAHVPALELLAHRMVWGAGFLVIFCLATGRTPRLAAALGARRTLPWMLLGAVLICFNWGLFIWAILNGFAVEASLGYFILPIMSVLLGVVIFRERIGPRRWAAVVLAAAAVVVLGAGLGTPPWIALSLAASFAVYSTVKKMVDVGPIVSVTAESLILAPAALLWLAGVHSGWWSEGADAAGFFGADWLTTLLLVLAGPATALPLILYAEATRGLPLSTVGLIFYINPALQAVVAVFIFAEPFTEWHAVAFALIALAIVLFVRRGAAPRAA